MTLSRTWPRHLISYPELVPARQSYGCHSSFQGFLIMIEGGRRELWDRGAIGGGKTSGDQLGWCHTHTTKYSSDTLIGSWNEERFDVTKLAEPSPSVCPHSTAVTLRPCTMYNTKTHKIVWIHWQCILLQSHCGSGVLARDCIYYIIVHV